jgi:PTH1 family peptidyl-tRNA hydrolase
VLDEVLRRWALRPRAWKSVAEVAVAADRAVILAKPKTFMNLSGEAVGEIVRFHKLEVADVLVVVDEVQLPLGRLRLRPWGSAGGHNGLKSIIEYLGTEFPRLRIGVGRGDPQWDLADHVLSVFRDDERSVVQQAIGRAADAVETFVEQGVGTAMNRFNAAEDRTIEEKG